jgi:acetylglutamate kinase
LTPTPSTPTVIKLGGALLDDAATLDLVWQQVALLRQRGEDVVVVHGGGPQATRLATRLGHTPRIVHGRRVTTDLDLDIALWTFRGSLNTALVAAASRAGVRAAGVSGVDGATLQVHRRPPRQIDGESVDFGWVGDVDGVDTSLLEALLASGFVPVVAPLGIDASGEVYNVNADTVAVAIAGALSAHRLLFVAASGGLRRDQHDPATRLATCDAALLATGLAEGWITDGMRVKVETALAAAATIPNVAILPPAGIGDPASGTRVGAGELRIED